MNQPLRNGSYTRTYGSPGAPADCWPRFFMDTVLDLLATERTGREVWKDVERVEINMPGNPFSKPVQEVGEEQKQRWPKEYEAFKKGQEVAINGTPIDVLPFMKPSLVRSLKALDIMTAEQLAAVNDHAIQHIGMGGRRLKELAISYLDDREAMAIVQKTQAENDRKDQEIASLRLQVESLQATMQNWFNQMQQQANTPNPLLTNVPGMSDPIEIAKFQRAASAQPPEQSAFDNLPVPPTRRRRGGNHGETQSGDA